MSEDSPIYNNIHINLATVFSGIGAIEYAIKKMNIPHSIIFASDIDPLCKQTYFANYNVLESQWHNDITTLDATKYNGMVDLIMGGSPCQSFSTNGKRMGLEDPRGSLIYQFIRVIKECAPKVFIFENVRGLTIHNGGSTWKEVKQAFSALNYNIFLNHRNGEESPIISATEFGIPQNRQRIYLIGFRKDLICDGFQFPKPIRLNKTVKDFLDNDVPINYYLGEKGFKFVTSHPTRAQVNCPVMKCQKRIQQYNWNGDFVFVPLTEINNPEILNKAYVGEFNGEMGVTRKITPTECQRLMGFDDDLMLPHPDHVKYNQIGNSVVVPVLTRLVSQIIKTHVFDK